MSQRGSATADTGIMDLRITTPRTARKEIDASLGNDKMSRDDWGRFRDAVDVTKMTKPSRFGVASEALRALGSTNDKRGRRIGTNLLGVLTGQDGGEVVKAALQMLESAKAGMRGPGEYGRDYNNPGHAGTVEREFESIAPQLESRFILDRVQFSPSRASQVLKHHFESFYALEVPGEQRPNFHYLELEIGVVGTHDVELSLDYGTFAAIVNTNAGEEDVIWLGQVRD